MIQEKQVRILRKPDVLSLTGFSPSTLHVRIREGLFIPPVSLGDRAVGWVSSEVNMILEAMVAGESKDKIKYLVSELVKNRREKTSTVTKFGSIG